MDADSFFDKLLASLGPIATVPALKPPAGHPEPPPAPDPPHLPASTSGARPRPAGPTLPDEGTNILTTSPEPITPIAEAHPRRVSHDDTQSDVDSRPTTVGSIDGPANSTALAAPKSSATLEAELRAKLLAASRKRKATSTMNRPPPVQKQRPPRGSPVFTTVSVSVVEDAHVSPPPSAGYTNLALPPKPPQREGFRLRIKLPFPSSPSSEITVETERLPLTTPVSAILDLFNRRSPHDCLYFPPPAPAPAAAVVEGNGDPAPPVPTGQRFYHDPPRGSERLPGWRDLAAAHGGPNWDGKPIGNLRSTLEDVSSIAGAEVVDCELRCEPARQILPEQPESEWAATATSPVASPVNEDERRRWHGQWQSHPHPHFQWPAVPYLPHHAPAFAPAPWIAPEPDAADTQRWIPGHKDYDDAGWRYGFGVQPERDDALVVDESVPEKKGNASRRREKKAKKRRGRGGFGGGAAAVGP